MDKRYAYCLMLIESWGYDHDKMQKKEKWKKKEKKNRSFEKS